MISNGSQRDKIPCLPGASILLKEDEDKHKYISENKSR